MLYSVISLPLCFLFVYRNIYANTTKSTGGVGYTAR